MKTTIRLNNSSYFLYCQCKDASSKKAILIVPNSAGYFAKSTKYGEASSRIDKFCDDLSEKFHVYYLILSGQDPSKASILYFLFSGPDREGDKYSYSGSVDAVIEALKAISQKQELVGVIGMCTGGAIATEAMGKTSFNSLPLILYNTAASVGWNDPAIQKIFLRKYRDFVNLDCEELQRNAPASLVSIVKQHKGKMLQIASGNSDYKIERQRELTQAIPGLTKVEFPTMSDAPIGESPEYQPMMELIFKFFSENK